MTGQITTGDTHKRPGRYSSYVRFTDGTESPVFDNLQGLFGWMRGQGIELDTNAGPWNVKQAYVICSDSMHAEP